MTEKLFDLAQTAIPGGVNSPVRAFGSVGGDPIFVQRAQGAYIYDTDGRQYVDLVCTWGPSLLGHAHPQVVEDVTKAAQKGLSFGAPTLMETRLANAITARVPAAQKVRMVSTGTEATMTAIRLARGFTGRNLIVKFAGCYHGHSDALLAAAGSGLATQGLPGSAGVTASTAADTLVLPYNDAAALEKTFQMRGTEIAAVITEAAPANMGIVPPRADFNQTIRTVTAKYRALMISDEVLTGFRCSPSGFWGIDGGYRVGALPAELPPRAETSAVARQKWCEDATAGAAYVPDIFTFGKVVGGGMPLAALGGRAEIMDYLAPVGPVYQAGTLSGNPLATAAGYATLRLADAEVYARVDAASAALQTELRTALDHAGLPYCLNTAGNLFSVFFGEVPACHGVSNYEDAGQQNASMYRAFFHAMLKGGVALPPSCFEAWFVSAAHDEDALNRIMAALPDAVTAAGNAATEK
ncbi:MAG: glutamate-1-semialdehyde 2,1-aminomutase [Actinomycetaceae bacterium]|nr:glutamate-1-semialdehyde 2,1-aminomutase [Actinomycetaceae bacterium]